MKCANSHALLSLNRVDFSLVCLKYSKVCYAVLSRKLLGHTLSVVDIKCILSVDQRRYSQTANRPRTNCTRSTEKVSDGTAIYAHGTVNRGLHLFT